MKKRLFLAVMVAFSAFSVVSAQVLTVGKLRLLPTSSGSQDNRVAAFSPCGTYLLLTSANQQGLVRYDLASHAATSLTTAEAAGISPRFSADGRRLIYRENVVGKDHRITTRLLSRDLQSRETRMVQARMTDVPLAEAGETTVGINHDLKITVSAGGRTTILAPQGTEHSYIWAALSPDGTKISYYCSGVGGFVCDLEGRVICSVGDNVHAAKWYDNETLVGMEYRSDGQRTVAAAITACTLDGRFQRLTDSSLIALYPQVSAGKIAFSTPEGDIYLMNVTR